MNNEFIEAIGKALAKIVVNAIVSDEALLGELADKVSAKVEPSNEATLTRGTLTNADDELLGELAQKVAPLVNITENVRWDDSFATAVTGALRERETAFTEMVAEALQQKSCVDAIVDAIQERGATLGEWANTCQYFDWIVGHKDNDGDPGKDAIVEALQNATLEIRVTSVETD